MTSFVRLGSVFLLSAALLALSTAVRAYVPLEGWLIATKACPASRSIRKPADSVLEPGYAYPLLGKNKALATHYQLRLTGDEVKDRWVAVPCGIYVVRAETSTALERVAFASSTSSWVVPSTIWSIRKSARKST